MSLHPDSDQSVPDDTAAVARAIFPQGTACLRLRDRLGPMFADEQFANLFPKSGQPAEVITQGVQTFTGSGGGLHGDIWGLVSRPRA